MQKTALSHCYKIYSISHLEETIANNLSTRPSRNTATIPYFFKQEIPNPLTTPASPKAAPRRSPYLSLFIN